MFFIVSSRNKNSIFKIPALANTKGNKFSIHIGYFSPLCNGMGFIVDGNDMIRGCIVSLLTRCRPTAIKRLIVPIIINAVKRVRGGRLFTHISEEVLKLVPAFANLNAATAIACIIMGRRFFASFNHRSPSIINRGITHAVFARWLSRFNILTAITTARFYFPSFKSCSICNMDIPTVAKTQPKGMSFISVGVRFYNKATEFLVSEIKAFRHNILRRCSERLVHGRQSETAFQVYSPIHAV